MGKRIAVGIAGLLVLLVLAGGLLFWMRPLAVFNWMRRQALTRAGLEKTAVETALGRQVLWQGGSGPTLVLLHGAGDQAGTWAVVAPDLTREYRVLVLDLSGHGDSEPAEGSLTLGMVVQGLEAVLEQKADEPVILVGNSMGAWLSMLYAHTHPEQVVRVVAVNGGPLSQNLLASPRADLTLTPADREQARRLMAALRDPSSPPVPDFVLDDIVRRARTGAIGRMPSRLEDYQPYLLDGRLQEIKTPVDLLWGESDQLLPLSYAERLREGLPAARLTELPRCGHVPQLECPERFLPALKKLLHEAPPSLPEPEAQATP